MNKFRLDRIINTVNRFIIPSLILFAFMLILDVYVFQAVKTTTIGLAEHSRRIWHIAYWAVTAFTIGTFIVAGLNNYQDWQPQMRAIVFTLIGAFFISKFIVAGFLLLDDVIRLGKWGVSLVSGPDVPATSEGMSRSEFLSKAGLILAGIPVVTLLYGVIRNAYNYRVHRHKVHLPHLPESFDGLKIVQISDIHSGSFTEKDPIKSAITRINELEPDLIFFTGDLVNYKADEMDDYIDVFDKLKAKHGIFSVMGNHDYGDYMWRAGSDAIRANASKFLDTHKQMGWDLLLNEHRIIQRGKDKLAIIGVENWSAHGRFGQRGDMTRAMAGCEDAAVKLLLSHDPTHWEAEVSEKFKDVDITFSGHTHGAQFGVENKFLKWSPSQYFYKHWAGLYQKGKQYLYVNRGFGFIGYPGRVGILPEITVMELVRKV